jgi:hypothetical protein
LGWQFEKKYLRKLSCTFIRSGSLYSFRIKKVNQTIECLYMTAIGLITPFFPNGGSGHIGYKFSKLYIDNSFNFIKNLDKNFIKLISYKPYNRMFVGNTLYYNRKQLQIERWLKKNSATILKSDDDGNKLLSKSKKVTMFLSILYSIDSICLLIYLECAEKCSKFLIFFLPIVSIFLLLKFISNKYG